jgi:hypothetical protein
MLGLMRAAGRSHDHLSAGGVLAGEDEQGAQQGGGFGGVEAEAGEDPPVLEFAEAVLSQPPLIPVKKKWSLAFRADPEPY